MEEKIVDILKEQPLIIPRSIFNNYKKLNITEEELLIIICIINFGNNIKYDPEMFVRELKMDKYKVMELINSLIEKNIITMEIVINNFNKKEESISLDILYNKLLKEVLNTKNNSINDNDVFSIFEKEFGRTLSPMEYEIIKGWINSKISKEIITEALKEAIYNGVNNFRYIDKIIYEWNKKGYKTKDDIVKDKEKYKKSQKEKIEVFDYNWLEDE